MKHIMFASIFAFVSIGAGYSVASTPAINTVTENEIIGHGGGCRKSSPPGQCCHQDRKTGIVHCH